MYKSHWQDLEFLDLNTKNDYLNQKKITFYNDTEKYVELFTSVMKNKNIRVDNFEINNCKLIDLDKEINHNGLNEFIENFFPKLSGWKGLIPESNECAYEQFKFFTFDIGFNNTCDYLQIKKLTPLFHDTFLNFEQEKISYSDCDKRTVITIRCKIPNDILYDMYIIFQYINIVNNKTKLRLEIDNSNAKFVIDNNFNFSSKHSIIVKPNDKMIDIKMSISQHINDHISKTYNHLMEFVK